MLVAKFFIAMLPNRLALDFALFGDLHAEFFNEFLLGFGWLFL